MATTSQDTDSFQDRQSARLEELAKPQRLEELSIRDQVNQQDSLEDQLRPLELEESEECVSQ